jgi:hypothetical protein
VLVRGGVGVVVLEPVGELLELVREQVRVPMERVLRLRN